MTSIEITEDLFRDLFDRRHRRVIGTLSKNENSDQISFGCCKCDADFLSLESFKKHVATSHSVDIKPIKDIKVEMIELISSDEENPGASAGGSIAKKKCDDKTEPSTSTEAAKANKLQQEQSRKRVNTENDVKVENEKMNEKIFLKCPFCSKEFLHLLTLNMHIQKCPKVNKNLKCVFCGKVYKSETPKRLHIRKHHKTEAPYNCKSCYGSYANRNDLMKHLQAVHANGTIEECIICNKKCSSKFHLKNHSEGHHGQVTFQCYICRRTKKTSFVLRQHLKTH